MALINCSECGKLVSNRAASCPHCGAPIMLEQNLSANNDLTTLKPQSQTQQDINKQAIVKSEKEGTTNKSCLYLLGIILAISLLSVFVSLFLRADGGSSNANDSNVTVSTWWQIGETRFDTNSGSTEFINGQEYRLMIVVNKDMWVTSVQIAFIDGQSFFRNETDCLTSYTKACYKNIWPKLVEGKKATIRIGNINKTTNFDIPLGFGGLYTIIDVAEFEYSKEKETINFVDEILSTKEFDITVPTVEGDKTFHFNIDNPIERRQ